MRFRQIVVGVVHVIVTAGQYIGRASETSTTPEVAEGRRGRGRALALTTNSGGRGGNRDERYR